MLQVYYTTIYTEPESQEHKIVVFLIVPGVLIISFRSPRHPRIKSTYYKAKLKCKIPTE